MNRFEIAAYLNGNIPITKQSQENEGGDTWDKLEDWTADRAMDVFGWLPEDMQKKIGDRAMKEKIGPMIGEYGPEALGTLAGMALGGTMSGEGNRMMGTAAGGGLGFLLPFLMSNDLLSGESAKGPINQDEGDKEQGGDGDEGPGHINEQYGVVDYWTPLGDNPNKWKAGLGTAAGVHAGRRAFNPSNIGRELSRFKVGKSYDPDQALDEVDRVRSRIPSDHSWSGLAEERVDEAENIIRKSNFKNDPLAQRRAAKFLGSAEDLTKGKFNKALTGTGAMPWQGTKKGLKSTWNWAGSQAEGTKKGLGGALKYLTTWKK